MAGRETVALRLLVQRKTRLRQGHGEQGPGQGIHHFGLTVRDVDASAAWYEGVLGFRRAGEFNTPNGTRGPARPRRRATTSRATPSADMRIMLYQPSPMSPTKTPVCVATATTWCVQPS
jgi:Glyoxalase/Bleomycin resistance protein/Dioxygenase superfamily